MTWELNPDRARYKFRIICLNRSHPDHFDEVTYLCSRNGQVVDIQCCIECEEQMLETPERKKQREIKLNERLIAYHQGEIGKLRQEILKLSEDKTEVAA